MLVNAVTRGGTNDLHGTAFLSTRSEGLARNVDYVRDQEYRQSQFGFSLGGPIVRDRVHFFIAPEFQERYEPATGPYLGQTGEPFPVTTSDIDRFSSLLSGMVSMPVPRGRYATRIRCRTFSRAWTFRRA